MAKRKRNTTVKLSKALILNRWMLSQFGVSDLESLADKEFKRSVYEGLDPDNHSHYYHYLLGREHTFPGVTKSQLLAWDQNIVSHTMSISEKRDLPINWKYFQYLSLLFTELYLERYFHDKAALLSDLNDFVQRWNEPMDTSVENLSGWECEPFREEELNKLAYWNATGSGKTLLMHINILQYRHYVKLSKKGKDLNKVLLVTPNEGLSQQHLKEFKESGIDAEIFAKSVGGLFSGSKVEIIEVSKLAENSGDKTVAVEAFETNNLVLVDEGHRGVAGEQWKQRRDQLSLTGFAFEYSATFGQAVAAANSKDRSSLTQEYSKTILMDYSYKYFYNDGYGKDYNILNVPDSSNEDFTQKYLTGALLSFYQQLLIHAENPQWSASYNLHKPLWVFVGGSVTKGFNSKEASDVVAILNYYSAFIKDKPKFTTILRDLLSGDDGIKDDKNRSVFYGRFIYLINKGWDEEKLYADILSRVFQTDVEGANIYVDQLKGQDGELGIRVGDSYFGVINVGDETKLFKMCREHGIEGEAKDFSQSLFRTINEKNSSINLLIGSRKFTEGWSSWRVSTMGLMNIGRSEGSQIIQLFGRGVRMKGYNWSLKRSRGLDQDQRPEKKNPTEILPVETLQIFGIRADYMQQFKAFLEEEGLPTNEVAYQTITIPMMLTTELGSIKLKVLQVKEGVTFKKDVIVEVVNDEDVGQENVKLEWYPKVQAMSGLANNAIPDVESNKLEGKHLAFVNWHEVYFALQQFKNERGWHNLSLKLENLQEIILQDYWYSLVVPKRELEPNSFSKIREWQEIVTALLKGYIQRYYNMLKSRYLSDRMETVELTPDHPNFFEEYEVQIEQSQEEIISKLQSIKELLAKNEAPFEKEAAKGFSVITFMNHLYTPMLYLDGRKWKETIRIKPVALVDSEYDFVKDLRGYYDKHGEALEGIQLYLLRNTSRTGVGFFEANGYYPDFILWLIKEDHQYISFIDPKGLRNLKGLDDPKIRFHKTVKDSIEKRIHETDTSVTLNAFITTPTPHSELRYWPDGDHMTTFNQRNVFFMKEQKDSYIGSILETILGESEVEA